ncbi:MAG: SDR family oxidoreductase [Thermoplasmata archaeon]|uniref:SDR family oxidoreductase n=1 Tax=Candidatus Sysuiplasma superficiale TaxID=2823368 RepID=A0A8J7YPR0_9ARCH|nr:SDR family oxidoreductase [Candidatus Sysuiplasma superficiale]MBX8633953.1 SDR family oxidoreductase [Candidatus Sysuiplasma jiujiangense]
MKRFVLVTGSSGGLGSAIAIELAKNGWNVALHYNRGREGAERTAGDCGAVGAEARTYQADLSTSSGLDTILERIREEGLELGGIVNNSGTGGPGSALDITDETWDKVQNVNIRAPVLLTKRLVPLIRGEGAVVNISSAAGINASLSVIAYEASKAALIHATRSMAVSFAPRIRVNSVAPGYVRTNINRKKLDDPRILEVILKKTPAGRLGLPEDVAKAVRFLMSEDASFITGETLVVDGGITLV